MHRPTVVPGQGGALGQDDLLDTIRAALQGRYEVAGVIGRGGMATVYHATDLRHRRPVALKLLFPELARAVGGERFLREISILARLSHPNILPLLDSGSVEVVPGLPVPWYVMPYVAEDSLRVRLTREGPLPLATALRYTRDLCSALAQAHGQGYIHRDIKPENILLLGDHAVLADFGIARAVTVAGGGTLSSSGLVVGTPTYMSPEQSVGSDRLDARSDLYSLGCVLYEMLAGQPPFTGATPQAISARHQFEPLPPIRVVRPTVPARVEQLLSDALAKTPADRIGSAQEFERRLAEAEVSGEVAPGAVARAPAVARRAWWRRGWRGVAAVAMAAIGLGVGATLLVGGTTIDPQRVVVLSFSTRNGAIPDLISGDMASTFIYDRLQGYEGLGQVDHFAAQSAIDRLGEPRTLEAAVRIARTLGSGKLIWGDLYLVGDTIRVEGYLYQVGRWGYSLMAQGRVGITAAGDSGARSALASEITGKFNLLTRQLLTSNAGPGDAADGGTSVYTALVAKASGDSAQRQWNLELARSRYRDARRLDPQFAAASLQLAQLGQWLEDPVAEWRPYAAAALEGKGLDSLSHWQARGLLALADSIYPSACDYYQRMIARDSSSFVGWFGLGECQRLDDAVVSYTDGHALRFRGSYVQALRAYQRALAVAPLSHRAAEEVIVPRLTHVLPTTIWLRRGPAATDPSIRYLAWADQANDTVVFRIFPATEVSGPDANPPAGAAQLIAKNRIALLGIVADWVRDFPSSGPAWQAQALMLERQGALTGKESATSGVARARSLTTDSTRLLGILIDQARIALRAGDFELAAQTSDAALRGWPDVTGRLAIRLASLAALTGRSSQCLALMTQGLSAWRFAGPDGVPLTVPPELARRSIAYYVAAVLGDKPTHLREMDSEIGRQVDGYYPAQQRPNAILALTEDAAYFAYPVAGVGRAHRTPGHSPSLDVQVADSRGDSLAVRHWAADWVQQADSAGLVAMAPEDVFMAAMVLLQASDTSHITEAIDRYFEALPYREYLGFEPQSLALLVRLAELRADLATRNGEAPVASQYLRITAVLSRSADK